MKLEVKDMYGLNEKNEFKIEIKKHHNFIYGINGVGKSSIANSLSHLINHTDYIKRFPYDSDNYCVKLEFDDIDVQYQKGIDINSLPNINRKVFVFNKTFIKSSLDSENSEGEGITPEIGIRITERNSLIKDNQLKIETISKEIKNKLKNAKLPSTQKELFNVSYFKSILGTNIFEKQKSLISLYNLKHENILTNITHNDFYLNNINIFINFNNCISNLTEQIISQISLNIDNAKYKINNKEDREFYISVVKYLEMYSGIIDCPVCLNTKIDTNRVIEEVNFVLGTLISNNILKEIIDCYNQIRGIDSYFAKLIDTIYTKIMAHEFPLEEIEKFSKALKILIDNYDINVINFANIIIDDLFISNISNNNKKIDEINDLNKEISNSVFVEQFDKMLEYIFQEEEIRAKSKFSENSIVIQLTIKGKEKEEKSIGDFFDIISESQKTKLSLAFFFALIVYKNESNKILCVFDDPIDSYDSISKYKMSRIIYEFITRRNFFENYSYECFSLFLSHSIEYFRLFVDNFRKSEQEKNQYYIFSSIGLTHINYESIFVIEGDYKILNELIHKKANRREKIDVEELISIIPIIRELADCSDKNIRLTNEKLKIDNNDIAFLNKFLSDNVIHGFDLNLSLKDLIGTLKIYLNINIKDHNFSDDETIFNIIKSVIVSNRTSTLDFYNEIILKNLIAIYVRAFYDSILIKIVKNYVQQYSGKTMSDIKNDNNLWTINNKITAIRRDSNDWNTYKDICMQISVNLTMLNDFAHSAGLFLTPLIDVKISDLYEIFDSIESSDSIFQSIRQLAYI